VTGYRRDQALQASEDYLDLEKKANPEKGEDVVLVTADSIDAVRQAYPNYFMDTKALVDRVRRLLQNKRSRTN